MANVLLITLLKIVEDNKSNFLNVNSLLNFF